MALPPPGSPHWPPSPGAQQGWPQTQQYAPGTQPGYPPQQPQQHATHQAPMRVAPPTPARWVLGPTAIPGAALAILGVVLSLIGLLAPWYRWPEVTRNGIEHAGYLMSFGSFFGPMLAVGIVLISIFSLMVLLGVFAYLATKGTGYKVLAILSAILPALLGPSIPLLFYLDGSGDMAGPATWAYGFAFWLCLIGSIMLSRRRA